MEPFEDIPEAELVEAQVYPAQQPLALPPTTIEPPILIKDDQVFDTHEEVTIFSAPRKFDTATLLIVTTAYAIYFSVMLAIGLNEFVIAMIAGFFTVVGLCQPILFFGKFPRLSSVIGGVIYGIPAGIICVRQADEEWLAALVFGTIAGIFAGSTGGYLCGALVGGVFLIAHYTRTYLADLKQRRNASKI